MQLTKTQTRIIGSYILPSDIFAYIKSNYSNYLIFLIDNYSKDEIDKEMQIYEENIKKAKRENVMTDGKE